jgi:integrase
MPSERAANTLSAMTTLVLLDAAGRRRFSATLPGHHCGRPPRNKGLRYPADPPTGEEVVGVMRCAGSAPYGLRARALIVLLWRAGLRISEALALSESDLDRAMGGVLVRRGKGGQRREVGMERWGWEQIEPWLDRASSCPQAPCCTSSTARQPAGPGRRRLLARPCAASPSAPASGAASPLISSVTRTRSRWHAKASRST